MSAFSTTLSTTFVPPLASNASLQTPAALNTHPTTSCRIARSVLSSRGTSLTVTLGRQVVGGRVRWDLSLVRYDERGLGWERSHRSRCEFEPTCIATTLTTAIYSVALGSTNMSCFPIQSGV